MNTIHKRLGMLAVAVAIILTGCESTREMRSEDLAAMAGSWAGEWDSGGKSTLTVSGDDPEAMEVEYCYEEECGMVEEFTFDDGTLGWRNGDWVFEFTLRGERVHGKLTNPLGTTRITMERM